MNKVILSSVIDLISGGTPKTNIPEYWDGDIGWLSVTDFNNDLRYVYESEKSITKLGVENSNTKFLEIGDIIISARGTVGVMSQIGFPMCFNQSCFGMRGKKEIVTTDYLYYALKNYINNIIKRSQGSVFNTINLATFDLMEIEIHDTVIEQCKVTKILSDLDEKIELNNQINSELEAMTKLIYDYWFVQFDFPDENGEPYKSSGGKMVYNDDLKRKVPYGWIVRDLGSVTNILRGDLITSDTMKNGSVKVVSAGVKSSNFHDQANRSANVITVSSSGNAGYVNFWREPIFASDCITIQAGSAVETILALQFLKMIQMHIYRKASGSVQPHVYPSDLSSLKYLLPPKNLVDLFEGKVIAVNELIGRQNQENDKLEKLRDWLLPMLMNGQVKIK